MRKHIIVGVGLLLTLGSAVAGSLMYGHEEPGRAPQHSEQTIPQQGDEPTAMTLAMWTATAVSADYSAPKLPI